MTRTLFKGNKNLITNDNGHSLNLIKIPCCIRQLYRTFAAMATAPETLTFATLFAIMSDLSES